MSHSRAKAPYRVTGGNVGTCVDQITPLLVDELVTDLLGPRFDLRIKPSPRRERVGSQP